MLTINAYIKESKINSAVGIERGPLVFYSDAFLTELTWQVLIEGYSTSLSFVHQLTFGLR